MSNASKIKSTRVAALQTAPRKKRRNGDPATSNYFITINTNQRPPAEADREKIRGVLDACVDVLLTNASQLDIVTAWYTEAGLKGGERLGGEYHSFDGDVVKSVTSKFSIESDGSIGTIHAHIMLKVEHYGTLVLDPTALRKHVFESFQRAAPGTMRKWPNVKIRLMGNANEERVLESYMAKELEKMTGKTRKS
jgi:hypothetical protein